MLMEALVAFSNPYDLSGVSRMYRIPPGTGTVEALAWIDGLSQAGASKTTAGLGPSPLQSERNAQEKALRESSFA